MSSVAQKIVKPIVVGSEAFIGPNRWRADLPEGCRHPDYLVTWYYRHIEKQELLMIIAPPMYQYPSQGEDPAHVEAYIGAPRTGWEIVVQFIW